MNVEKIRPSSERGKNCPSYVVITPARNEAAFIEKTIQSMLAQTVLPAEWVLVDDGSTDQTGAIIDRYASEVPWIRAVHRNDRGYRKSGGGVMEAFYDGFERLHTRDWDFIVKLDGDLSFEPDYFERCFARFEQDPRLGIAGGLVFHWINGALREETTPHFHVRGATKIYRKECWQAIGGLLKAPGWDTLDEVKANMLGWKSESLKELKIIHHRYTGSADGTWGNWVKNGRGSYIVGYHPLFMTVKCLSKLFEKPYFFSSLALLYGFLSGYWKRIPRVDDPELIRYLRQQQLRKLFGRDSIWN